MDNLFFTSLLFRYRTLPSGRVTEEVCTLPNVPSVEAGLIGVYVDGVPYAPDLDAVAAFNLGPLNKALQRWRRECGGLWLSTGIGERPADRPHGVFKGHLLGYRGKSLARLEFRPHFRDPDTPIKARDNAMTGYQPDNVPAVF